MPPDKSAKDQPKNQGRTFRVIKGLVGPWPHRHVFTEAEFKRLNPIPKSEDRRAMIDVDTYHEDLLTRLTTLGVIQEEPGAKAEPTPLGPENGVMVGKPAGNPAIQNAVKEELERQKMAEAQRAAEKAQAQGDPARK